ncbi:MAG: carbohydrate kinase [Jaaginema sp. PMC 1079.18]|nr:carbohydrate kinase [Jaaginema sp. PMC 1080.18]MEC4849419.1 carbohydrate kinase [Jaaginema sp. PMC 1079.18]MEC4864949.1 carbohydrate kinase [Jaaginema sp. PMC 1078.18]
MKPPRVLCLGEILFDCLANQVGRSRVSEVESWTAYPGGAPANVACALVKLGIPAAFIGCVGQDKPGGELLALLTEIGVDVRGVQQHSTQPTRQVYVLRSAEGDRGFAGFGDLPPDNFADAFLDADLLSEDLFQQADYLVLGTLELAYPQTRKAIFKALELADRHHVKVVMDVNWRPMFWPHLEEAKPLIETLWSALDFVKLADDEAQLFFDTEDAGAIAHRLNSVEGVLVTAGGAKPVSYCLNDNEGKVTPVAVTVEDTTGAGDAFVAGFVAQLCQRGIACLTDPDIAQEIVRYACAVGGLTTTKPGAIAAQPTLAEVTAFLQR